MKIPTEAELIEMENQARRLRRYEEWEFDRSADSIEELVALVRELRPCQ